MTFDTELKKGNMVISDCTSCKKITWPPSEICNQCLEKTSWRKCSNLGKIIEFSKHNDIYFGIVEFEKGFRIIGTIIGGIPATNKTVEVIDCGISDNDYSLKMKIIE